MRRPCTLLAAALLLTAPGGCTGEPPGSAPPELPSDSPATGADGSFQGRIFERTLVFLSSGTDTLLLVPWLHSARTRPGEVERAASGLVGRGGSWEPFMDARWTSPPLRTPWRLLPHGGMRLVVGEGGALDRMIFEEGARQLELAPGEPLAEWGGQRGETVRLAEGTLLLPGRSIGGVVLDLSRARRADDDPPGDWTVLASGDSLRVFLHQPFASEPGAPGSWRGWALVDFREPQYTSVTVTWEQVRAYERARRDVPVRWDVRSGDGELQGTLEATGVHLEAGEGEGPQLPVAGLFQVEGTLGLDGEEYPVRGLFRHLQR